ncbi:hypothetical protein RJT34_24203 [Clitoria ternatea]|uniref:Agenet domain-containing protein n=1 Tax=Clitoria ternatea TaxID=43366 RepID=A0AAN9IH95_CLITE
MLIKYNRRRLKESKFIKGRIVEVSSDDKGPCPPEVPFVGSFKQFQEVDAWYNDGWWEGVVLKVPNNKEYFVSFIHSDVLKFENCKLRPHQDWFDGKLSMSSKLKEEADDSNIRPYPPDVNHVHCFACKKWLMLGIMKDGG